MRNITKFVTVGAAAAFLGAGATQLSSAVTSDPVAVPKEPRVPLASVSGSQPGVRLSLMSLRRSGKRMTVKLRVAAAKDAPSDVFDDIHLDLDGGRFSDTAEGIRLIDNVNGREMPPVTDIKGRCVCSSSVSEISPGQTIDVFAAFAAPAESVERLSVAVPSFPSIDDVLVEKAA